MPASAYTAEAGYLSIEFDTTTGSDQGDNKPKTATPFWVPTYTLPFTTIGVMNLFPLPKLSRPFAAWLLL